MYIVAAFDIKGVEHSVKRRAEAYLSDEERERYIKFHHSIDADLFLFGRYLTRSLVASISGKELSSIRISSISSTEKPYLEGLPFQFSISHSGRFVAVAVSDRPIGIDVQVHESIDIDELSSFFTENEKSYVGTSVARFYRLWTAVESLAKITGLGFNEGLRLRKIKANNFIETFLFDEKEFTVTLLKDTEAFTISVVSTEPLALNEEPLDISRQPNLKFLKENLVIYSTSGRTEPAV